MVSITQIKEFNKVAKGIEFRGASRKEKYEWIEEVLMRLGYFSSRKRDKTIIKKYIQHITGFSDAQLTRLIAKKKRYGKVFLSGTRRHSFERIYTAEDVARLIETDKAHDRLSGPATKKIFQREYFKFGKEAFRRLAYISVAHIYNLRGTRQYWSWAKFFTKTKPVSVNIGERRKPQPQGKPGYLRIDSVHQGDLNQEKGVYHINIVDEVTQWELVGSVEAISEYHLLPLLMNLLKQFPFTILEFHSDNGSEFINRVVAKLLNNLLIRQTKSRARRTNDNALVEGKNGSVIRKHMGYIHIPKKNAQPINEFYQKHLNVYLNFHRPCGFATITVDHKGRQKKIYDTYLTPYEKFQSLQNANSFLNPEITFETLNKIANEKSDNECAALMQKAKVELFKNFKK